MSPGWEKNGKRTGVIGAATGVLAGGAAVGLAVERFLIGRRKPEPDLDLPLGSLHGVPAVVRADDGIELYAEVEDPPGGVQPKLTVVFVHGYALNMDCWHFQRRVFREAIRSGSTGLPGGVGLPDGVRMVFYDQRSHGRSGRSPSERCTVDQTGRDLDAVIEQLAPSGPLLLIGHSMGGMSVLSYAGDRPSTFSERVVGVGLLASAAGDMDKVTLGTSGMVGRLVHMCVPPFIAALSKAPDLVEHGRKAGSDIGYLMTKWYSFGSKVPASRVEFMVEMLSATPIDVVADFFPGFGEHDEYDALSVIERCETLVMAGVHDAIVPVERSRDIAEKLPLAEYDELAGCGHMLILEYPEIVNERLLRLLNRSVAVIAQEVG